MYTKTVMIIDDDEDDRMLFCEALLLAEPLSRVLTAYNGEKALQVLHEPNISLPDFIFLDLNMPRMSGWQCLEHIRKIEQLGKIPVIIFSTSKETDFDNIELANSVYFFSKPTKFDVLVNGIKFILNSEWMAIKELNKSIYA